MAKNRESSTDRDYAMPGGDFGDEKKPNWVDLAHLDSPMEDSLANQLIYKPALRFHGLTGGLWGAGVLSDAPSIPSDRPPSYKMVESIKSRGDGYSDIDTIYNNGNISAISPLTLRRRNTMAVVLVAIALLAAVATITGVTLHFLHPKALLRANVRFTIANTNFTEDMANSTSLDFHAVEQPLCEEMDNYFLSSELAEFYLGCKLVSLRHDDTNVKNGTAVHFNLDFIENSVSNDGDRIKRIITRRADRHKTDDTLYLVIKDFLVYLRSLRVDLEVLPLPDNHPGRTNRPKIPWNRDVDFIPSKFGTYIDTQRIVLTETKRLVLTDTLTKSETTLPMLNSNINVNVPNMILPRIKKAGSNRAQLILRKFVTISLSNLNNLLMSKIVNQKSVLYRRVHGVNVVPTSTVNVIGHNTHNIGEGIVISPTQSSTFHRMDTTNGNIERKLSISIDSPTIKITNQPQYTTFNVKSEFNNKAKTYAEREETKNTLKLRHVYPRLQPSFEVGLKSKSDFSMINTEALGQLTNKVDISEVNKPNSFTPKITTVASNMFIIQGTNTVPFEDSLTSSITKMDISDINYHADEALELERFKEHQKRTYIMDTEPTRVVEAFTSHTLIRSSALSLVKRMDSGDVDAIKAEPKLQINEIVDPKPKLEPVINFSNKPRDFSGILSNFRDNRDKANAYFIDETTLPPDTEWINVFNQPQQTYLQYVGDLSNNIQTTNEVHANDNDLNNLKSLDKSRSRNDVVVVVSRNTIAPTLYEDDTNWTNTTASNFAFHQSSNPESTNNFFTSENGHRSVFKDFGLPIAPYQNLEPTNHVGDHVQHINKNLMSQSDEHFGEISSDPVNDSPSFYVQTQVIDGQPVLMLIKQDSPSSAYTMPHAMDKQTLDFLQNIGMNMNFSDGQVYHLTRPRVSLNANGHNKHLIHPISQQQLNNFIPTGHQRHVNTVFRSNRKPRHDQTNVSNKLRPQIPNYWLQRRYQGPDRKVKYPTVHMSHQRASDNVDVFSVSLRNINTTVKNTYGKLESLQGKLNRFNSSLNGVTNQVKRLNETYGRINKTLESLNESRIVINGTMLDVITKLADMDSKLQDLNGNVVVINSNITSMNSSLLDSLKSLVELVQIVSDFDTRVQGNNRSIVVNLKQKDLLDTIRMLLNMNGTLTEIGENVDDINKRIDMVDDKLEQLEQRLSELDTTLDTIDSTFKTLNETLRSMNHTVMETNKSLASVNTTIASMNTTFKGINETLNNINNTLSKVDRTLNKIKTTSNDLNVTLKEASETLNNEITQNIQATNESTNKLNKTIAEIGGPVTNLKLQIHNANESLRIIQSRADIVKNSYRLLNDTLTGMDETVAEITKKLDETSVSMAKTNSSLSQVNTSIEAMQHSFSSISDELQSLQESLITLEERMHAFGPAFPQINNVIKDTQDALNSSKQNIANMNQTLQYSNNTRDGLVSRFETLHETFEDVRNSVQNLEQYLNGIKNKSSAINTEADKLETNVVNTVDRYSRTEKNIKYIDNTHQNLLDNFKILDENKSEANKSIIAVKEDLKNVHNLLENQFESLINYPNIDAGMDDALSTFLTLQTKLEDVRAGYDNGSQAFDNVDGMLWDDNGHPVGVHLPFSALVNKTKFVNQTFNDYADLLRNTSSSINEIHEANQQMRKHFDDIESMKRTVDKIKREESYLNENIHNSSKDLRKLDTNMSTVLNALREKLDDVKLIEKTFGDINGTYNVSVDFNKLESVLVGAIENIENALHTLAAGKMDFENTINLFDKSKELFSKTVLRRDAESFDVLNNTLQNFNDTKGHLYTLQDMFSEITGVIENAHIDLQEVSNNIAELEDILTHQKRKNNYVTKYQPILEDKFNDLFQHYNSTNSSYESLLDHIQLLNDKISTIRQKSDAIQNVNISLVKEGEQIVEMENTISTLTDRLMHAKNNLDETYNNFTIYDDTNRTFEEVREEYQTYRKNIRSFESLLRHMNTSSTDMTKKTDDMMSSLHDIEYSLTEFTGLKQPIEEAYHSQESLKSKINATNELIIKALGDLQWLSDNFDVVKRNYSNFTETDVDISDLFLSEAIETARKNLDNVTSLFSQVNITGFELFTTTDQITTNYSMHNYDRTNINTIIGSYLKPTINHIGDTNATIHKLLDSITVSVSKTDMSLSGINDTLHATNKQLFEDRQKKLLADTRFSDLEQGTHMANESIATTADKLQDQIKSLQNVMKLYNDLTKRLDGFPSVNISLHNESIQLNEFNQTLQNTSERILDFLDDLKAINDTLWLAENERYLQNETVGDIKKRYKLVDDKLNTLLSDINNLGAVLDSAENGTNKINHKLRLINDSLNRYEERENILNELLNSVHHVEGLLEDTVSTVDKVEDNLRGVIMRVDGIKNDFSGINRTVFDKHVNPIETQIKSKDTEIKYLKGNISNLAISLTSAKEDIKYALHKNISSISSQENLDLSIEENKNIGIKVDDILDNAIPIINKMNETVTKFSDSLDQLKNNVSIMENTFILQEKLEYFEEHFPGDMYKNINETMMNVKVIASDVRTFLASTNVNFNTLNSSLVKSPNLVFDIAPLTDALNLSNETLGNTTETLQQLLTDYEAIESLLRAVDGLLVSDNETLQEMKNRYENMYTEMNNIQSVLDNINKTLNEQIKMIHDTDIDIASMMTVVNDFEIVREDLRKHEDQFQDKQPYGVYHNNNFNNSSNRFVNATSVLRTLQTDFGGVTSSNITNLTASMNERITNMTNLLKSYKANSVELDHLFDNTGDLLSNFTNSVRQDHNDTKTLRGILNEYPFINKTLRDQMLTLNSIDSVAIREAEMIDGNLEILAKDIDSLRKMYEEQAKIDYFENHIPSLRHLRKHVDKEINSLSTQVQNTKSSQEELANLFQVVNNRTSEQASIEIPLSSTQKEIDVINDTTDNIDSTILNLQRIISGIDEDIITEDKYAFIENRTIDDLIEVFSKLNNTLISLKENATYVNGSLNNINMRHSNISSFLDNLKEETERLVAIQQNTAEINDDVLHIEQTIDRISDEMLSQELDITKIDESIAESLDKSSLLKNQTLFKRANQIHADIMNLRGSFSKIRRHLNESEDDFFFIQDDYKTLKNVINNSSFTIDELKAKSREALSLLNHLSNEINIVNSSVEGVTMLQQQLDDKAKLIIKKISNLEKDIAEQEKVEYIQEHAPIIKDLIRNSTKMINVLEEQIIPKIDASLEELENVVTKTLNISVSEPSLQVSFDTYFEKIDKTRQNSSNFIDRTNATKTNIVKIKQNMLLKDGSYFGRNNSLADVMQEFDALYNMISESNKNISDVHASVALTVDDIYATNTSINDLKKEIGEYIVVKKELESQSNELRKISENGKQEQIDSKELFEQIGELNATLLNTTIMYADVKDDNLGRDSINFVRQLNGLQEKHSDIVQEPLIVTHKKLSDVASQLDLLNKNFKEDTFTVAEISNKTKTARNFLKSFADNTTHINHSFERIGDKIEDHRTNLTSLNNSIIEFRERLKKQQIYDYIKEHFPTLLEKMEHVNQSLTKLDLMLPNVNASLTNLESNVGRLFDRLSNLPNVSIPLDHIHNDIVSKSKQVTNASTKIDALKSDFNALHDLISNNIGSNETLDDIKSRFKGYESELMEVVEELGNVQVTLNNTDISMKNKINEIDRYHDSVDTFKQISDKAKDMRDYLLNDKNTLQNIADRFDNVEDDLQATIDQYNSMVNMYSVINNTDIHNDRMLIEDQFAAGNSSMANLLDKINHLKETFKELNISHDAATQTLNDVMSSFKELENVSERVNGSLNEISIQRNNMNENLKANISSDVKTMNNTVSNLKEKIRDLKEKYMEEEKNEFVKIKINDLKDQANVTSMLLNNTLGRIFKAQKTIQMLNDTRIEVQNIIDTKSNLLFSTTDLENELQHLDRVTNFQKWDVDEHKETLDHLDISGLPFRNWTELSMEEIKLVFNELYDNLTKLNSSIDSTDDEITGIDAAINETSANINNSKNTLDTYAKVENIFYQNEDKLADLSGALNDTNNFLENMTDIFDHNVARFDNVTSLYPSTTNSNISRTMGIIKEIHGKIDMSLPLASTIFKRRYMENYNTVTERFDNVANLIFSDFVDEQGLFNILKSMEDSLNNVTLETKKLADNNKYYHDDSKQWMAMLNNSTQRLNELDTSLMRQVKLDLLNANIPELQNEWRQLNDTNDYTKYYLNDLYGKQDVLMDSAKTIAARIEGIETLNMSTNTFADELMEMSNISYALMNNGEALRNSLMDISVFDVDVERLATDPAVSVSDVQGIIQEFRSNMEAINTSHNNLDVDANYLHDNLTSINKTLSALNNTLNRFYKYEGKLKGLNNYVDEMKQVEELTISKLSSANVSLDLYQDTLTNLSARYKNYNYDSIDIENMLNLTENILAELRKNFSEGQNVFADAQTNLQNMTGQLYRMTSDSQALNKSLQMIESDYPITEIKLTSVNETFNEILRAIPNIAAQLKYIDDQISLMNDSLNNEHNKLNFVDNALPVLQEKYQRANKNFMLTNETLEKMAKEIAELKMYVDTLKGRMNDFETVNVSMTDIDNNVTFLEDRLIIIQDHYKDVAQIVNELRDDINAKNIFGRNITLLDIEEQYRGFNGTIDKVNEILKKINEDAQEAGEHFDFLNSTVSNIDNALDVFEEKSLDIKDMNRDIKDMEKHISESKAEIDEFDQVVQNLSRNFNEMQSLYSDVFDYTAENNSQVQKTLDTMNTTIANLKSVMNDLEQRFNNTGNEFADMNGTMFEYITTYDDLNNTLQNVKDKYVTLSKALHRLQHDVNELNEGRNDTKSVLLQLSSALEHINDTLYKEQEKFNFIRNNMGDLDKKFKTIKGPLDTTSSSLQNVSMKVNTTERIVDDVANKLKKYGNIKITLDGESQNVRHIKEEIENSKLLYDNFTQAVEALEKKVKSLDARYMNLSEITSKYNQVDSSLDDVHRNLTNMLSALDLIDFNSELISNRSLKLDRALDELNQLETSSSVLNGSLGNISREMEETGAKINEVKSNADDLFTNIEQMQQLYKDLDNNELMQNLTDLLTMLNQTKLDVIEVDNLYGNTLQNHSTIYNDLRIVQENIKGDIFNQSALDVVNENSKQSLDAMQVDTDNLNSTQRTVKSKASNLMDVVEQLTKELYKLNETMSEENQKQQFMEENFPHLHERYNSINTVFGATNGSLNDTNGTIAAVASKLLDVRKRLDSIEAIAIPLDAEGKEIQNIQQKVKDLMKQFTNASDTYHSLKMSELQDKNKSFKQVKSTYADYNKTLEDMETVLNKINSDINELNISTNTLNDSVSDINFTVDEYEESGNKIATIKTSGDMLSNALTTTNESVTNTFNKLQNLNDSFETMLQNFSHIDDPEIKQAQDLIKSLFLASKEKVGSLKQNIGSLHDANKDSHGLISNMNDTHKATKTALDELKLHLQKINDTGNKVKSNIQNIESQRLGINNDTDKLNPELDKLMDKINDLAKAFLTEQEKIDFISTNEPVLIKRIKDLSEPFAGTLGRISLNQVKLADLKYAIKTTGTRLDKFKTINITTDNEMKEWETMNGSVDTKEKTFNLLRNQYQSLQNTIKTINDRSISKSEIDEKIKSMNTTLNSIENGLALINTSLKDVENKSVNIDNRLNDLSKSMDNFKNLQEIMSKTANVMKTTAGKIDNLTNKTGGISRDISTLDDQIKSMTKLYAPLNDKTWNSVKGKIEKGLTSISQNVGKVNKTLNGLGKRSYTTSTKLDTSDSTVKTSILTRDTIDPSIQSLLEEVKQIGAQLTQMQSPITNQNKQLGTLQTSVNKVKAAVTRQNTTLHKELLKYNFVKENLPSLQSKHTEANQSFIANFPDMDSMKGSITNLVSFITKIKEKMMLFGLDDTDQSLKKWDDTISKLNNTVIMIEKKNKETLDTLNNLKKRLWSSNPMYTRKETVENVETRFRNINKTLDDIKAASHTIKISLNDVGDRAAGVISQLMEKDSILTTTPATTTPSGPPEWLTMDSTIEGEIGKDSAFVECAATDLTEWNVLWITRVNRDGVEEKIAGWRQGSGARKMIRDKRIKAQKILQGTGGKLYVTIQPLQCEDEGSYYCYLDSYDMWPLETSIGVISPPEDNITPDFPTEVFEDKITNFSCTGRPGYPEGRMTWMVKHQNEATFRPVDFYSSKRKVSDAGCVRTETNIVEYQFNMTWNNTKVRCYIENTDYFAEGKIQLLPYDICNKVRYLGTISHPYTPHKYIVCGKELNIMQCPGDTCYDVTEENCRECKIGQGVGGDPCRGKSPFTYVAHEYDCQKYYLCLGQTKTQKKCPKGFFNPDITGNCGLSYAQSLCGQKEGSTGR
ncbi:hypothetical protein ACF0H5_020670 [Mactra antiquata]